MVLDGHVHIWEGAVDQAKLLERMRQAGVDGGNLFSQSPASFSGAAATKPFRRLLPWSNASGFSSSEVKELDGVVCGCTGTSTVFLD